MFTMIAFRISLLVALSSSLSAAQTEPDANSTYDVLTYVDPLIGSSNGGWYIEQMYS